MFFSNHIDSISWCVAFCFGTRHVFDTKAGNIDCAACLNHHQNRPHSVQGEIQDFFSGEFWIPRLLFCQRKQQKTNVQEMASCFGEQEHCTSDQATTASLDKHMIVICVSHNQCLHSTKDLILWVGVRRGLVLSTPGWLIRPLRSLKPRGRKAFSHSAFYLATKIMQAATNDILLCWTRVLHHLSRKNCIHCCNQAGFFSFGWVLGGVRQPWQRWQSDPSGRFAR